ncbi:Dehydrogenases with different specificities [Candidatus Competibacter denitrificans Run_A_D11]|uniref:Dehydrogenases with different specificities n=1 Tax=Candidatus Competibacter denitrificans Run_A_D11 TaxID=1400863 RepID=W6MAD8_9GAMM|nr:mycofactocin-coupled SDR family oxidoreductase [Candidatus Competibacter denitrificans]CDI02890.1 Dehydrogenases with different specificities [Candidatus Competibacter denitrificans Run_A_D11]
MGKLEGKVAFITGAARGQGRAHAVLMAREGADIAALDICHNLPYPRYALAERSDLEETAQQVRESGRQVLELVADVRDSLAMAMAVEKTIAAFGHIDILVCNAGIADMALTWDITEEWWDMMIDVNLKGYWLAVKYVVPHMLAQKTGGSIVMTSSVAGLRGEPGMAHYCASKWGVIGLANSLAQELAPHNITVNTLHPTAVDTDIITGMAHAADMATEDLVEFIRHGNALPVKLIDAQDVANAALWLVSDEARYVTGQKLNIDAGRMLK